MLAKKKRGGRQRPARNFLKIVLPTTTSNFVKQAETIGLMPLGQTNAPEFGFKNITDPALYGPAAILGTWNIRQAVPVAALPQLSLAGLFL